MAATRKLNVTGELRLCNFYSPPEAGECKSGLQAGKIDEVFQRCWFPSWWISEVSHDSARRTKRNDFLDIFTARKHNVNRNLTAALHGVHCSYSHNPPPGFFVTEEFPTKLGIIGDNPEALPCRASDVRHFITTRQTANFGGRR
jgi:hypothetical protein